MKKEKYKTGNAFGDKILDAFYPPDEFILAIIYAPLGYGKSSFKFQIAVSVLKKEYGLSDKEAWEYLKRLIVFHPTQFFDKLDESKELGLPFNKLLMLLWDDAGLWLWCMDWDDPFLEQLGKWLNVARTDVTCLMLSSPVVNFIFKKLRDFTSVITVKIIKNTDKHHLWRRIANGYQQYKLPDLKKTRVKHLWSIEFNCKLPDHFYRWYKPIRDTYAKMAKDLMKEKWLELQDESVASLDLEHYPELEMPSLTRVPNTWFRNTNAQPQTIDQRIREQIK